VTAGAGDALPSPSLALGVRESAMILLFDTRSDSGVGRLHRARNTGDDAKASSQLNT
jgi:hypothetical protein